MKITAFFSSPCVVAVLSLFALVQTVPGARAAQIELTASQITTTWENINGALIVVAASTAIDDDWTQQFKTMAPEPASGKTLADVVSRMEAFRAKLNAVLAENEMDAVNLLLGSGQRPDDVPVVYRHSGQIMDSLILMLNRIDPLAFIAQYYAMRSDNSATADDAYAAAELANRRMDEYMTENGIEMPEEEPAAGGTAGSEGS